MLPQVGISAECRRRSKIASSKIAEATIGALDDQRRDGVGQTWRSMIKTVSVPTEIAASPSGSSRIDRQSATKRTTRGTSGMVIARIPAV